MRGDSSQESRPLTRPSATLSPQAGRGTRDFRVASPSPRLRGEGARRADEGHARYPLAALINASMCDKYFSNARRPAAVSEYSVRGMRPSNDFLQFR